MDASEMNFDHPDLTVTGSRSIVASPSTIWATIHDDDGYFRLRPSAVEHTILVTHATGGHDCRQVYEKDGKRTTVTSQAIEFVPPERAVDIVTQPNGLVRSTMIFTPDRGGTKVSLTWEVVYTSKPTLLTRRVLRSRARRELIASLELLDEVATRG